MAIDAAQFTVGEGEHVVQFYERDEELIGAVGTYLVGALQAGEVALVIATEDHRRALETTISAAGIDVRRARQSGAFLALDANETMSRFVVDGRPDAGEFRAVIGGVLRQASDTGRPVRAFVEMVALLWDAGQVAAAIELEDLWNELGRELAFSLFCAYPTHSVSQPEHADAMREVCHLHSAVIAPHTPAEPQFVDAGADLSGEARLFDGKSQSPRTARRFVVDTLQQWGHDELVDDAAVVVTELATNAVLHTRRPFMVALALLPDGLRISVHDTSPVSPMQRWSQPMSLAGRGLGLVATLASRWGTEVRPDGKVVWADLRRRMQA